MSKTFVPSYEQARIGDHITGTSKSMIIQAVAGAGKTTTIAWALGLMKGEIFLGAYNKAIAKEIEEKVNRLGLARRDLRVSTFHAAGFGVWKRRYQDCAIDGQKTYKVIDSYLDHLTPAHPMYEAIKKDARFISMMVSFGKQMLVGIKSGVRDMAVWHRIVDHFGTDSELDSDVSVEEMLKHVIAVFEYSRQQCPDVVDFNDMIYAPLAFRLRFWPKDFVIIDEGQDINPARLEMARRMLKPDTGRLIGVGDRHQAIYGFTGAGGDSLVRMQEEFECIELPLSVTYRCAKAIVRLAQTWVPHIRAHDDAPEGIVRPILADAKPEDAPPGWEPRPWYLMEETRAEDAVLCRYTKPLVKTAYAMIRNGISCKVEGRDIGKGLIQLATRWKNVKTVVELDTRLGMYLEREQKKARETKNERRAQDAEDKVGTLRVFIERAKEAGKPAIEAVVADIERLFSDDVSGVLTLSTGHKAKGREWDRVFWLESGDRRDLKPWQEEQEQNLKYVITTRARHELILVPRE